MKRNRRDFRPRIGIALTAVAAVLFLLAVLGPPLIGRSAAAGAVIYVDRNASFGGDGTSWGTAYKFLQDAIANANNGDEIWVAKGVYFPDRDETGHVTNDDPAASFALKSGVSLYGGFAGTESSRDERDWQANRTVLSGDIQQNDIGKSGGVLNDPSGIKGVNSIHVVTGAHLDDPTVLDGFAVTGGDVSDSGEMGGGAIFLHRAKAMTLANLTVRGNRTAAGMGLGGGVLARYSTVTIREAVIRNNLATGGGGGVALVNSSNSLLENLLILENEFFLPNASSVNQCAVLVNGGGGLYSGGGTNVALYDVQIEKNVADCYGGGMQHVNGALYMQRVSFVNNHARDAGYGMPTAGGAYFAHDPANTRLENVLVMGNLSDGDFGGLGITYGATPGTVRLVNGTVVANEAQDGGALGIAGDPADPPLLAVLNTIVWNNSTAGGGAYLISDANLSWENSLVQESGGSGVTWNAAVGTDLGGNLDTNPSFLQPPSGSAPNVSADVRLAPRSQAVNKGTNAAVTFPTDLAGSPRIYNAVVDMGVYENPTACPDNSWTRLYVNSRATGAGTGESWTDAMNHLQDALALSDRCFGNTVAEIWVAAGTYYPDEGAYQTDGDRTASFQLRNGLAIYGGFLGNEANLSERDPRHLVTTLSGDISQDDERGAHDLVIASSKIKGANSFHVVNGSFTDASARLDGFAITSGRANGSAANREHEGGGVFVRTGGPLLANLLVMGNVAREGGGMAAVEGSVAQVSDSWFVANSAFDYGGALHNENSNPTLVNVLLSGGRAANGGGAIYNVASSPTMTNVTVTGNVAGGNVNLTSYGPQAPVIIAGGGGMLNINGSKPLFRNGIIWANRDEYGIGAGSGTILNQDTDSTTTADYSLVQNLAIIPRMVFDANSIDANPAFVEQINPSSAPSVSGDFRLRANSQAIDKGKDGFNSLPTDLAGAPRIQGTAIDMGAYEMAPVTDIALYKTSDVPAASVGDTINYTYRVINTSGSTISGLDASDDALGAITLNKVNLPPGSLAAGTLSTVVESGDLPGPLTNTATVSGTIGISTVVIDSDTEMVSLSYRPQLAVTIAADKSSALPGATVTFAYEVTNIGDVELNTVAVNDSRMGAITLDTTTLAPGATAKGSAPYVVVNGDLPGPLVHTAAASGLSPAGTTVEDQATAIVLVIDPKQPTDLLLPVIFHDWPPPTDTPTPTATATSTLTPTPTNTPTVTNTPTITPTPTDTPTSTPTNTPSPIVCDNIVANSGFEQNSDWYLPTTAYSASYTNALQHTGARSVRTGITAQADNIFSYSSAMQTVTIPFNATKADLTYWLWPYSTETMPFQAPKKALEISAAEVESGAASDVQLVLVLDTFNQELKRLYGERRNDQTWILRGNDLWEFRGQTIKLYFGTFNNGLHYQGVTAMFVDDVMLEVCAPQ